MKTGSIVRIYFDNELREGVGYVLGFIGHTQERVNLEPITYYKVFIPALSALVEVRENSKGYFIEQKQIRIEEDTLNPFCLICESELVFSDGKTVCPKCTGQTKKRKKQ
jgi:Zn finger protein HypA/HybF involved in hydrogenase expression